MQFVSYWIALKFPDWKAPSECLHPMTIAELYWGSFLNLSNESSEFLREHTPINSTLRASACDFNFPVRLKIYTLPILD